MSQVDNRNSTASKRARPDGSRREDDWTCPSCGNVNFSFRTNCNMRNCTQSKPADHYSKSAAKSLQGAHGYSISSPFGSAASPSMYLGMPPYGHSLFNGGYMPPYDVPFSGSSGYHYNYGNRLSTGSTFRPLPFSGPSPFSLGSMMGNGGLYGLPPIMDRYRMGLPMAQLQGPRPVFFQDDKPLSKDSARDNDWTCPNCGNVNFSFRPVCNIKKCNTTRPGSQPAKADKNSQSKCNRQNCGADKPSNSNESVSSAQGEYEL